MYQTTNEIKDLFLKHYKQTAVITFDGVDKSIELTESDIIQGSLSVDRYCVSGEQIEIGSAIASELTFNLDNRNGKFDDFSFEGAELYVKIGIKKWDADRWEKAKIQYIPLGYFTIDTSPRKHAIIEIAALDRMVKFDRHIDKDKSKFMNGLTVGDYVRLCCQVCGVVLKTDISTLPNVNYKIPIFPDKDDITFRQIIQWCALLMGTCAYIDWNGELRFEWYDDNNTDIVIAPADRYDSDIYENDIVVTGITFSSDAQDEDGNDIVYLIGTDEYAIDISDCELLQDDYDTVLSNLFARLGGFTYRPYSCTVKPMPYIYPLDKITFIDKKGNSYNTIVTNTVFKMNGNTTISGKGETATSNSYDTPSLTAKASAIVSQLKKDLTIVSEKEQMTLHLNEMIGNAMGLYCSQIESENGAIDYYFHSAESLAESSVIYTFNAGGFAWTDNWNDGNPVWQYGITSSGNAILNYLTVNNLTADQISVESIVGAINSSTGESELRISAEHIDINGVVSANGTFTVDLNGFMTATGGEIAGLEITRQEITDVNGNSDGSVKRLGNKTDTFHILVTEDKSGNATETEVLITDLLCDYVKANNSPNLIDLCYQGETSEITANLTFSSAFKVTITGTPTGNNWVIRTATFNIALSGMLLADKKISVTWGIKTNSPLSLYSDCTYTTTITIPKGTSGVYTCTSNYWNYYGLDIPLTFAYFSENNGKTITFTTAEETNTMVGIYGGVIPLETNTFNFGHEDKMWKEGYFNKIIANEAMTLAGNAVSAPYLQTTTTTDLGVSSKNKPADSEWTSAGTVTINILRCGKLKIATVTYTGEIATDKWYFFNVPSISTIYGVSLTPRATRDSSLSNIDHAGQLCAYWNSYQVTLGCDENKCANGFTAIVIGF